MIFKKLRSIPTHGSPPQTVIEHLHTYPNTNTSLQPHQTRGPSGHPKHHTPKHPYHTKANKRQRKPCYLPPNSLLVQPAMPPHPPPIEQTMGCTGRRGFWEHPVCLFITSLTFTSSPPPTLTTQTSFRFANRRTPDLLCRLSKRRPVPPPNHGSPWCQRFSPENDRAPPPP